MTLIAVTGAPGASAAVDRPDATFIKLAIANSAGKAAASAPG